MTGNFVTWRVTKFPVNFFSFTMSKTFKILISSCSFLIIVSFTAVSCFISGLFVDRISQGNVTKNESTYYVAGDPSLYLDPTIDSELFNDFLAKSQDHFYIEYETDKPEMFQEDVNFILANLENQYSLISQSFGVILNSKIKIVISDDFSDYEENLDADFENDEYDIAAYAYGSNYIEIYLNPNLSIDKLRLLKTISHELVHTFQFSISYGVSSLPEWFIEGTAESLSYPKNNPIVHSDIKNEIPNLSILNKKINSETTVDYVLGYDIACSFITYVINLKGEEEFQTLLNVGYFDNFDNEFEKIYGKNPDETYDQWLETL